MSSATATSHLLARPQASPALYLAKTCRRSRAIPFQGRTRATAVVRAMLVGSSFGVQSHKRLAIIQQAVQTEKGSLAGFGEEAYRLELAPDEATRSLRFTEVRDGDDIRIVVSAVEEGSTAQESGVRPGQRLLTVSDPINVGQDLEIVPGTKVKKVYDTIQLSRAAEVSFQLSQSSVEDNPGFDVAKAQEGINLPQTGGTGQGSSVPSTQSARPQGGKSEMEQKYAKRMVMRDEYMNKEPSSDKGFFGLIFAMLVVPAVVILGVAFASGYMDTISNGVTQ